MSADILKHFDKNNLHHAYLIEGAREEIVPEITKFLESLGIKTVGNSDFIHINLDSFKIDDARYLKSQSVEKGISINPARKGKPQRCLSLMKASSSISGAIG